MGAGEGVTFPSVQSLVRGWVPADGRSRALTLTYAAAQLGTVVALLTAPVIISAHGWEAVFYVYGSFGFAWSLLWWPLVADVPPAVAAADAEVREHKRLPPPEQAPLASSLAALPWRDFFASKPFLAILFSHAAFGVGHYVTLTWLPSFYAQRYDLDVASASLLSVFPWVLGVAVSSLSGVAADALSNRGLATTGGARKLMQGLGAFGPALCLAWLAAADAGAESAGADAGTGVPVGQAAVALTLAISLAGFQSAGFASNHQDIAARYAPVLFGITNATSSLLGTASVYGVGTVLDAYGQRPESGWAAVWAALAGCYVLGGFCFLRWSSSERQFD
jgi:sugar phosphate permease